MSNIKAIVWGLGATGKMTAKLLSERGVRVVGAIGNNTNIARDIGEIVGLKGKLGVKLNADADAVFSKEKADIAIICVKSDMAAIYPMIEKCVEHKVNVLTIAEEALYPWKSSPQLTSQLDTLAKKNGVTISASGFQDVFWVYLATVFTGASHSMKSVEGETVANFDHYGPVVLDEFHIGRSLEDFLEYQKAENMEEIHIFQIGLEAIIDCLGMRVKAASYRNRKEPIIAVEDTYSHGLARTIKKGQIIGISDIDEVETLEGIKFQGTLTGKIFSPGETETTSWTIKGEPDLYMELNRQVGLMSTCSIMINRIPDVINSEPGFLSVDKLPLPRFKIY